MPPSRTRRRRRPLYTVGRSRRSGLVEKNPERSCHICHTRRPITETSVISRQVGRQFHQDPKAIIENVRFCKDKPECETAARTFSHLDGYGKVTCKICERKTIPQFAQFHLGQPVCRGCWSIELMGCE